MSGLLKPAAIRVRFILQLIKNMMMLLGEKKRCTESKNRTAYAKRHA